MAHHVYTTNALVLDSGPGREADKLYTLLTRDLGKIRATAQGVRLIKSKLRFSLQDFSLLKVSIVRGKEFWRIVNAVPHENLYQKHKDNKDVVFALAQVFLLLKRFVPDEEKNELLFEIVIESFQYLQNNSIPKAQVKSFEYILVLRILDNLGYLGSHEKLDAFITEDLDEQLMRNMEKAKKEAVAAINRSMRESQL
jgi:DNA repair protein RecO (recombination protein O)